MSELYNRIKTLSLSRGLSLAALSKKAGVSSSILYELKQGNRRHGLSRGTAEKLAAVLGVTVDEIYGEEKAPDTEVSEDESKILELFAFLTDEQQQIILRLVESMVAQRPRVEQIGAKLISSTDERLKEIMNIKKISQAELSRRSGVDKGSISLYLSGKYSPKADNLYQLATALNVESAWLFGFDVPMSSAMAKK